MNFRNVLLIGYLLFTISSLAQVDSLQSLLQQTTADSSKLDLLVEIGWTLHDDDPESALGYANQAEQLIYKVQDAYRAEKVFKLKAFCYGDLNDRPSCLENHLKRIDALHLTGESSKELAGAYFEAAAVLNSQGQVHSAEDYFTKAMDMSAELGEKGIYGLSLLNLAEIKSNRDAVEEAKTDLKLSVKVLGDYSKIYQAYAMTHLANMYIKQDSIDQAEEVLLPVLRITEDVDNPEIEAFVFQSVGEVAYQKEQFQKSLRYYNNALAIWEPLGRFFYLQPLYLKLGNVHANLNTDSAAYYYQKHIALSEQVNNEDNNAQIAEMEAKFQNAEKEKKISLLNKEKDLVESENKRKSQVTWFVSSGLIAVVLFAFFLANRMRLIRNQKDFIDQQKQIVEEKSKELTDSIQYAKRIQTAIIPTQKIMDQCLPENFVLYLPKDIVAGDFYWLHEISSNQKNKEVLIAAADCTGHGVPGAMVSVICNNGLNRSVREYGLKKPAQILDKTREIVLEEFEKSEEQVKDGMDIALVSLSPMADGKTVVSYSGAHNPLWIIREGASEVEEIKADKQPIGEYDNAEPYTNHQIELGKGDQFYIFSDGYVDQFGGDKGKKLKASNFKKILLSIKDEPMKRQQDLLHQQFENWKGSLEQLDDICVIGIRI